MSEVYAVHFTGETVPQDVTGRPALQALLASRASEHDRVLFFFVLTMPIRICAFNECTNRTSERETHQIYYRSHVDLVCTSMASGTCFQCMRWWCNDHRERCFLEPPDGRMCIDCHRNGLLSGDIIQCCNECNTMSTTKECKQCYNQFCIDCTGYLPLVCDTHAGLLPSLPKRGVRITMLITILADKRRRRRLPAELWQLIGDEFL